MRHFDARRFRMVKGAAAALAATALLAGCGDQADEAEGAAEPQDIRIDGTRVHPESITSDSAGNIYVSSIGGTIYRAEAGSDVASPWIVPDEANGISSLFGVLADDAHGLFWTCSNANSFAPGEGPPAPSAVKAFDLATGQFKASYEFPGDGPAACNDITIAEDGTAYATDTAGGRVFELAPGADALTLFASGEDLVGVDGIALSADGTMYINNVRSNLVQRVERAEDGSYAGLTALTLSEPVSGPDGLRLVEGNRFLQAEGPAGRVTYVDIDGDQAIITPIRTGLESSPGVTHVGQVGYATEGKIAYLMDPELQDQDPGDFMIRAFNLPEEP